MIFKIRALQIALVTVAIFHAPQMPAAEPTAETWRASLYPENWQPPSGDVAFGSGPFVPDFSQAGFDRGAEIPDVSGFKCFDVTEPPFLADASGQSDATNAIQSAIDAACKEAKMRGGQAVVFLPKGTFRVSLREGKKEALRVHEGGVVLKGAGSDQTFLLNTTREMRGCVILRIAPYNASLWTAETDTSPVRVPLRKDLTGPATRIPVADAGSFTIGQWVCIGQNLTQEWVAEFGDPSWLDPSAKNAPAGLRYLRQVVAVNKAASEIEVDLPVRFGLLVRDGAFVRAVPPPMERVGIEGLSIANLEIPLETPGWGNDDNSRPGTGAWLANQAAAIQFKGVANGWMRDVASFSPPENRGASHITSFGVRLRDCRSITLDHVRFSYPQYGGEGGNGYMFDVRDSGECLLRACSADFSRHGFSLSGMATAGNVLHACTDSHTARYTGGARRDESPLFANGTGSDYHMFFAHQNLVDSCTGDSSRFSAVFRPYGSGAKHAVAARACIYWNITGTGDSAWPTGDNGAQALGSEVVWSGQEGSGYIVGTSGVRAGVHLEKSTRPGFEGVEDLVEGVGRGASLVPQSLWLDQRARREHR